MWVSKFILLSKREREREMQIYTNEVTVNTCFPTKSRVVINSMFV
jgi:hypothetical protein